MTYSTCSIRSDRHKKLRRRRKRKLNNINSEEASFTIEKLPRKSRNPDFVAVTDGKKEENVWKTN